MGFGFGDFHRFILPSANRSVRKLRVLALGAAFGTFIAGFDGGFGFAISDAIFGGYAVELAGGFGFSFDGVLAAIYG